MTEVLNDGKIAGTFYEHELKKIIEFKIEKETKMDKLLNGKLMII